MSKEFDTQILSPRAEQLPVPYFHLAFTLPHRFNPWVQCHPEVIYRPARLGHARCVRP